MNKKNIKEVIEPEFKHEVRADVSIAELRNNKVMASIQVEPSFDRNSPIYAVAATTEQQQQEKPTQSVGPTEETDQKKLNQAKAAYNKCLQIMSKINFPEDQAQQICQLLTESMILAIEDEEEPEQQQKQQNNKKPPGTPSDNVTQQGPPMSGFVGNAINGTTTPATSCAKTAAVLNKEIEIKTAQIEKQNIELTTERQAHQSRMNQITELENTVHRLQLESYLRKHIDNENMIHYQAMKFASKGFNVEDLKDIYEDIPVRTASKNAIPKSKVRLRTASTDESNYYDSSRMNNVRETNEKLTNAFFGISSNNNLYDDYIG